MINRNKRILPASHINIPSILRIVEMDFFNRTCGAHKFIEGFHIHAKAVSMGNHPFINMMIRQALKILFIKWAYHNFSFTLKNLVCFLPTQQKI